MTLMNAEQRHRVPFQALCRMQRGDGDTLRRWYMLGLGATVQFGRDGLRERVAADHPRPAARAQQWRSPQP